MRHDNGIHYVDVPLPLRLAVTDTTQPLQQIMKFYEVEDARSMGGTCSLKQSTSLVLLCPYASLQY